MKQVFRYIALALLLFLTIGCRRNETLPYDIFGNDSPPVKLNKVTLTVLLPGKKNPSVDEGFAAIEAAAGDALNVRLQAIFVDVDAYRFLSDLPNLMERYGSCDLVYIAGMNGAFRMPGGGDAIRPLYGAGLLADITEAFPRYAPNFFARMDEATLASYRRDGKILAIPNYVILSDRPTALVREDFFDTTTLDTVDGLEGLEAYLDAVKRDEGDTVTPLAVSEGLSLMSIFANAYGYAILDGELELAYRWDDPDMKILAWEDVPEMGEIARRVQSWYRKGYFKRKEFYANLGLFMDTPGWGAWIAGPDSAFGVNAALAAKGRDFRYLEFSLFPRARAQRQNSYYEGFAIPSSSKNAERALMFVEWVHQSQEHYDLVRYGIKGKHYDLAKGRPVLPAGVALGDAFYNWQSGPLLDADFERLPVGGSPGGGQADRNPSLPAAEYPPHGAFTLDKKGLPGYSVRRSYRKGLDEILARGEYDGEALAAYRGKQKENGLDALIAAAQAQLNEWRETH